MEANNNEAAKQNILWFDTLRALASFGVIVLHVAAPALYLHGHEIDSNWWVGNAFDSLVRFSVPIFLLISGALLLPKTYPSLQAYFSKRVLRIVYPFLFWSIIYIAYSLFHTYQETGSMEMRQITTRFFVKLRDGASFHLWYVYLILGLYLIYPVLGKWLHHSKQSEIKYFIFIWVVCIVARLPFIADYFPKIELIYFSGYIGYPVLGYLLIRYKFENREKIKEIALLLIGAGVLITFFGTYFLTSHNGHFDDTLYHFLSPNVGIAAVGVFLLFQYSDIKINDTLTSIIGFFSRYSYGIYLVHVLVIDEFKKIGVDYLMVNPMIGIPAMSLLCLFTSSFVVWCIGKLPYGKYISG